MMVVLCRLPPNGLPAGVAPTMQSYSTNAKGNFQFERVITGWRNRPVLDLRLKK